MFPPALTPEELETLAAYKQQLSNLVVQTVSGLPRRREVGAALNSPRPGPIFSFFKFFMGEGGAQGLRRVRSRPAQTLTRYYSSPPSSSTTSTRWRRRGSG